MTAELESVSLAGQRATALALVFTELFQNALEHGGDHVSIALAQRDGDVVLTIADDGAGIAGDGGGHRALDRARARARRAARDARARVRGRHAGRVVFPV